MPLPASFLHTTGDSLGKTFLSAVCGEGKSAHTASARAKGPGPAPRAGRQVECTQGLLCSLTVASGCPGNGGAGRARPGAGWCRCRCRCP